EPDFDADSGKSTAEDDSDDASEEDEPAQDDDATSTTTHSTLNGPTQAGAGGARSQQQIAPLQQRGPSGPRRRGTGSHTRGHGRKAAEVPGSQGQSTQSGGTRPREEHDERRDH